MKVNFFRYCFGTWGYSHLLQIAHNNWWMGIESTLLLNFLKDQLTTHFYPITVSDDSVYVFTIDWLKDLLLN